LRRRIVKKIASGETFIETPPDLYDKTLAEWKNDPSKPCPMPKGHLMFKRPEEYGCVLIGYREEPKTPSRRR
jgi:hypothetical protein